MVYMNHSFLVHSSADGHLGDFFWWLYFFYPFLSQPYFAFTESFGWTSKVSQAVAGPTSAWSTTSSFPFLCCTSVFVDKVLIWLLILYNAVWDFHWEMEK